MVEIFVNTTLKPMKENAIKMNPFLNPEMTLRGGLKSSEVFNNLANLKKEACLG